ncbi:MAG: hypothetical protein CMD27_03025 [Flavobacteriales bacterium]|nr:hypothetical protein [Flavobacteriales bacterium]
MKKQILYFTLFIFCHLFSQDVNTLFSIGSTKIDVNDFMQNYYKNKLDTDTLNLQESLKEYLDLYIKFKLKVVEAEQLGLDTIPSFIRELEGYRRQLVKPYLTDNTVSEFLLEEAYERLQYEVSASHILIQIDDNNDTIQAYNKAVDLKKKLDDGANFISLAQKFSDDPSVKENNGDLGYFSALYMVYPFETAAYNTSKGSISEIVRTRFGYHILKVNDKRLSRGEVKVAHILIRNNNDSKSILNSKNKITEIYDSLLVGVNFTDLAKKFSDDKKSAINGGELDWFGTNKMVKKFEDVSFSLDSINAFSSPFQTEFGWHIVKLIDKKNLPPFNEIKSSLEKRIERDSRSQKTRNVVLEKLKKEWGFVENIHAKNFFYNVINEDFIKGGSILDKLNGTGHIMFVFNNQYDTQQRYVFQEDFAKFLISFQSRLKSKNIDNFNLIIDELYNTFKEQKILEIESANLEYKYDEFRLLYNEYHDGILMYQLQKDEVWDKAITDTLGLQSYYAENKSNYIWPNRVHAQIYTCKDLSVLNRVKRKLRRGFVGQKLLNDINKSSSLNLSMIDDVFAHGDNSLVDKLIFDVAFDSINQDDFIVTNENSIMYIDSLLPASYKSLEDVKGLVISDYQSFLEKKWLSKLEKKHEIVINNELFVLAQTGALSINMGDVDYSKESIDVVSFSSVFAKTVSLLGSSKDTFFGWNGQIYNTEINSP